NVWVHQGGIAPTSCERYLCPRRKRPGSATSGATSRGQAPVLYTGAAAKRWDGHFSRSQCIEDVRPSLPDNCTRSYPGEIGAIADSKSVQLACPKTLPLYA